jgi:O-antigen ligase
MPRRLPHLLIMLLAVAFVANLYWSMKHAFIVAFVCCAGLGLFLHCLSPAVARQITWRALVVTMGLPVLAWALPNVWLLYFAMVVWVPLVAARTAFVAPVYLYSLLLLPALDSTVALGSLKLFDLGVHDALAIGAAVALCVTSSKGRPGLAIDIPVVAALLVLSIALARDTTITNILRLVINIGIDLGLPYYIVSRGIRTVDEFRVTLLWLGCGAITLSAILVYEAWKAWPIYNELYGQYGVPTLLLVKSRGGLLRSGGPFVEPTSAAMVLTICIVALWLSRDFFRARWSYWLIMATALVGLSAPQSRGAWIGLVTAMVAALLFRRQYAALVRLTVVVGLLGTSVLAAAQFSPFLSEMTGQSGNSSESGEYRKLLLERGMQEFWHSPIFGYSMPEATMRLSDLTQGEGIVDFVNTYLWLLLISGVVGTGIFFGTYLFLMLNMGKLRRPRPELPGAVPAATFVFAILAMLAEMLFFTSFGGRAAIFVFVLFGCSAALWGIRRTHRVPAAPHAPEQSTPGAGAPSLARAGG